VNLAVSLHAAEDGLRTQLVPSNRRYPLADLIAACRHYVERTHRRITFEIVLMVGINDSEAHARRTAKLLSGLLCHVNLIPFNPIPGRTWRRSSPAAIDRFARTLAQGGIAVSVRRSRGVEIQAACGQLRSQVEDGQA
jgi:23S rRNA (adenine2503-C2)-methyltransferase